eukprot:gene13543-18167_t
MVELFDFQSLLASNSVFSGGIGLAVLAGSAQFLRQGSRIGLQILKRNFLVTLEITSKDRAYPWVLQWLNARSSSNRHLSVETSLSASNSNIVRFSFVPGPGQHFLHYNGNFMLVQRLREQQMVDFNSGKPWEKLQFTCIGRSTTDFESILKDAYDLVSQQEEGKTIIYTNWGAEWRQFGQPRKKRLIDSVILDEGVSNKMVKDVQEWLLSSDWYNNRGIPYRRGYLLYGPPGSGKSSFIMALAGKINYNICILNLSERGLTDDRLALAFSVIPPHSIVLLEDIDAAFPNRDTKNINNDLQPGSDVTFSGLLNVLDGVASSEDRLVFMTTNHLSRLDSALIRPGRVDYVQLIDNATNYQIKMMFFKFYPDSSIEQQDQFIDKIREYVPILSMAKLQGYLLKYKNNPVDAINGIAELAMELTNVREVTSNVSIPIKTTPKKHLNKIKTLTVEEVDRIYFNPQPGWDKDIPNI